MKVRESSGAQSGVYVGKFHSLVRRADGRLLHTSDYGPTVRYIVKSGDGVDVPGSFVFDIDDYRMRNVFGAFGTPLRSASEWLTSLKKSQFLRRIEQTWLDNADKNEVNTWVSDTGYIATIRPNNGSFVARFMLISSRDENDLPTHVKSSGYRNGKNGKPYSYEEDMFKVVLQVDTGPNEGATFVQKLDYNIKWDEEAEEWYIDKAGARGKRFYEFFTLHGMDLRQYDPEDQADPSNLLPALEPALLAVNTTVAIKVENGWIQEMMKDPHAEAPALDLGRRKKAPVKAAVSKTNPFVVTLMQVINSEGGNIYNLQTGRPVSTKAEKSFILKNELPRKPVSKYTRKDVYEALMTMGFSQLAKNVKQQNRGR